METLARKIGRYELQEEIGRGMMGVVYRALDPDLGRSVALKTVQLAFAVSGQEREAFEKRFLAEARAAAAVSHPNIVVVHDVGRDTASGALYIALEYLQGRNLAQLTAGEPRLQWGEALGLTARLAGALHHAHAQGIIHRDVKPANIMVLPSGEPKIMDFGIAKVPAEHLTSTGQFFGTPTYMSPEQACGEKLDGRSDLFSLGSVLYRLLTGRHAFEAPTVPATLACVTYHDPPPPSGVVSGLPAAVDYVLARALAKKPLDRYSDGKSFAQDIEDVLAGRPPRHRQTWTVPAPANATLLSRGRSPAEPAPLRPHVAVAETTDLRRLPSRVGKRGLLALAGLVAAGLVIGLVLLAGTKLPLPPILPLPVVVRPAQLDVELEHTLKNGTLRVWVDDDLVLEEPLESRVSEDLFVVKLRKGRESKTLDVSPGDHEVRLEVTGENFSASRRIEGSFKGGGRRRLVARMGGVLKKELTVAWARESASP